MPRIVGLRHRAHAAVHAADADRSPGHAVDPHQLRRGLLRVAAFAVIVIVLVTTLPGLGSIRTRLSHGVTLWIALACVLRLLSAFSYVGLFRAIFEPSMPWRASYRIAMAEIGTNAFLPAGGTGGLAVGGLAMRRRGMPTETIIERSAEFFVFTSAFNIGAVAVFGWLGTAGLLAGGLRIELAVVPAVVATAVVVLAATLSTRTIGLQELQQTQPEHSARWWALEGAVVLGTGAHGALELFRSHNPQALAGGSGYLFFDIATLWAAVHAFGAPGPVGALALAYLIGQLAGEIPVPGGIGVVDGGLIGALALYGLPGAVATAGALAYRAVSLGVPAVFGGIELVALTRDLRLGAPLVEDVDARAG